MTVGPTPLSPAIHSSGEWTSGVHLGILRLLLHVGPPPCGEIFAARHLLQTFFRAHEGSRADVTHVAALSGAFLGGACESQQQRFAGSVCTRR